MYISSRWFIGEGRGPGGGGVHPTGKLSRLLKYDEHVFLTIINRLLRGHVRPKLKGEEGGGHHLQINHVFLPSMYINYHHVLKKV